MERWEAEYLTPVSRSTSSRTLLLPGGPVGLGTGESTSSAASFQVSGKNLIEELIEEEETVSLVMVGNK